MEAGRVNIVLTVGERVILQSQALIESDAQLYKYLIDKLLDQWLYGVRVIDNLTITSK